MSSKIFQNVITQMKDSLDRTIGVTDDRGVIVSFYVMRLFST